MTREKKSKYISSRGIPSSELLVGYRGIPMDDLVIEGISIVEVPVNRECVIHSIKSLKEDK